MELRQIFLTIIVLGASIIEAVSGFGSTIISVTLGANFYQINTLVAVLLPLNILLSAYIVSRYFRCVDTALLLKRILPFMTVGLAGGLIISKFAQGRELKIALGVMVILFSVRELAALLRKLEDDTARKMSYLQSSFWMIAGGVIHGIYASGGPMLVYSISGLSLPKKTFRATLSAVWLILNIILTTCYVYSGKINVTTLKMSGMLFPTLPLGLLVGELLHQRINERVFRIVVFSLLILAGVSLVL